MKKNKLIIIISIIIVSIYIISYMISRKMCISHLENHYHSPIEKEITKIKILYENHIKYKEWKEDAFYGMGLYFYWTDENFIIADSTRTAVFMIRRTCANYLGEYGLWPLKSYISISAKINYLLFDKDKIFIDTVTHYCAGTRDIAFKIRDTYKKKYDVSLPHNFSLLLIFKRGKRNLPDSLKIVDTLSSKLSIDDIISDSWVLYEEGKASPFPNFQ